MSKHAVAILLASPEGIPLLRGTKKPAPIYWKLPGGRSESEETAEDCALREIEKELGVILSMDQLIIIHWEDRGNHTMTIFLASLSTLPVLRQFGDEGEEIRVFTPGEILKLDDFFPNHRKVILEILKAIA